MLGQHLCYGVAEFRIRVARRLLRFPDLLHDLVPEVAQGEERYGADLSILRPRVGCLRDNVTQYFDRAGQHLDYCIEEMLWAGSSGRVPRIVLQKHPRKLKCLGHGQEASREIRRGIHFPKRIVSKMVINM